MMTTMTRWRRTIGGKLTRYSFQIATALLFAIGNHAVAQVAGKDAEASGAPSQDARQWEITTLSFNSNQARPDAVDVDFSAELSNDAGDRFDVPGFWNGGNEYLIRFTPTRSGTWRYATKSSLPELNEKTGEFDASSANQGRKGGVIVPSDSPRRFGYQNGDSYFPIAFECDWLFALDAENPDDFPKTRTFVDSLADNGFNQVVMNVFAYDVTWKKDAKLVAEHDFGSPNVFPFAGSNSDPDHSRLNIDYFKRLDRVIAYLDQKGIAAHLMIYVWNKQVNWPDANSEADNRYFDYVVKRYQAYPNLIWDVSKEALGYGHTDIHFISDRIDRLRKLDAHDRLVTVHDYGYCRRFPDKLDFISVQLWGSELYGVMRKMTEQFPKKPILNIEHGGYEEGPYRVFTGNYTSPDVCLERAYQCVFAGTYPTHYWQGAAWNVIIADIESLEPRLRPKLEYYRHLSHLVEKYGLAELQAGGKHSNSGFCLHDGADLYVYYVPKENMSMNLRFPKEKRGQTMMLTWFDPFTGVYGDPIEKEIVQWPIAEKPTVENAETGRFAVLIVNTQPTNAKD